MNPKKKGNAGENAWARWLQGQGFRAWRDSASGGSTEKSDVQNTLDAHFEVKTVKRLNLQDAWRQAERDSAKSHAAPHVVIHFDGMGPEDWLVVLSNHDWVELVKKSREPKTLKSENRDLRWKLSRLIQAAKELLREVEKP